MARGSDDDGGTVAASVTIASSTHSVMTKLVAVRALQGAKNGSRPYSLAALAREAFERIRPEWERELAAFSSSRSIADSIKDTADE